MRTIVGLALLATYALAVVGIAVGTAVISQQFIP